jgi:hypothetical protein
MGSVLVFQNAGTINSGQHVRSSLHNQRNQGWLLYHRLVASGTFRRICTSRHDQTSQNDSTSKRRSMSQNRTALAGLLAGTAVQAVSKNCGTMIVRNGGVASKLPSRSQPSALVLMVARDFSCRHQSTAKGVTVCLLSHSRLAILLFARLRTAY